MWALLLCACMLAAFACGNAEDPVATPAPRATVNKRTKPPAVQKKARRQAESKPETAAYSYDATGKPDPFVPLIAESSPLTRPGAQKQVSTEPLTPLQKYDLNDLKLVAVITKGDSSTALLEDAAGYGYIVCEGTPVGRNSGIIKTISGQILVVEEQVYSASGTLETKDTTLTIQHKE